MTKETLMKLSDVAYKWLTPVVFGLAAMLFSNLTESVRELARKIDAIDAKVQAVDTRSAVNDQRLRDHIEADRGRQ